jgi:lysophospholipase L1-like esterase
MIWSGTVPRLWVRKGVWSGVLMLSTLAAIVMAQLVWFRRRGARWVPGPHVMDGIVGGGGGGLTHWVWLGDSLSAGVGAANPQETLPRQTADMVARQMAGDIHLICLARPGAMSADVLAEQVPRATTLLTPGMTAVVAVGCNDSLRGVRPSVFKENYRTILVTLRTTGANVVAVGLPDMASMMAAMAEPLRTVVGRVGRYLDRVARVTATEVGAQYVAIGDRAQAREWRAHPAEALLSGDRWHPNGSGYGVWAAILASQLTSPGLVSRGTASGHPPLDQPPGRPRG